MPTKWSRHRRNRKTHEPGFSADVGTRGFIESVVYHKLGVTGIKIILTTYYLNCLTLLKFNVGRKLYRNRIFGYSGIPCQSDEIK